MLGSIERTRGLTARLLTLGALAATPVVLTADPAAAVTVSTEVELRNAYGNAAETDITLANDIDLVDCGAADLQRTSTTPLTIHGNGFTIRQTCPNVRVMRQSAAGPLTLENVTLTGGNVIGGGGALNSSGPVTLTGSTITSNSAAGGSGGGMLAIGDVTITNSTITDNSSPSNEAGGIAVDGNVVITSSTINGNSTDFEGGGVQASGDIVMTNSTVTGNTAVAGRGGGLFSSDGNITIVYSTIVANNAPTGANLASGDGDFLFAFGSVVGAPQGGGENCDNFGTTESSGYNYENGGNSCGFGTAGPGASTDVVDGADPQLGALAANGGPTLTMLPASTSPLVDAIPTASCGDGDALAGFAVTTDQRALPRPALQGCDIGAVELQPEPPPPPAPAPVVVTPTFTG